MINEVINLRNEEINGFMPTLTTYIPYDSVAEQTEGMAPRKRAAIVICPGGGYSMCSPREAEPIALNLCNAGFSCFVLDYCVAPIRYPEALKDVSAAIRLVRKNAEKWAIYPDKIAVCGFSAGGHLAASIATLWNSEPGIMCGGENKPNALILAYPVILWGDKAHKGSFHCLLGSDASEEEYEKLSLEKRVSENTPPSFIWHTFEDTCVPVENSLSFAGALRKNNIPFELHIYPKGGHGLSLATEEVGSPNPHVSGWAGLCAEWLNLIFE